MLIALATVGLIMVFVLVASYVSDVRSEVEPKVAVLALRSDIAANQPFTDDTVGQIIVPERWVSTRALRDRSSLSGLVAGTDLPRGAVLQQGMAIAPPQLEAGQREIAILVNAETGVAGKVTPGSFVDVIATFDGQSSTTGRPKSEIIVPRARVIDVGQPRSRAASTQATAQPAQSGQVVPVTFALRIRDELRVIYAESYAAEVRLALIRPGDDARIPLRERTFPRTR